MAAIGTSGQEPTRAVRLEFRATDILLLGALGFLVALEITCRVRVEGWTSLVLMNGLLILVYPATLLVRGSGTSFVRVLFRTAACMGVTSLIYNQMGRLIHAVFAFSLDAQITAIETAIFGTSPNVWAAGFSSVPLTEVMTAAYLLYVPLLPAIALEAYRRGGREDFESFLAAMTTAFLTCYFLYIVAPVMGPSRFLPDVGLAADPGSVLGRIIGYMRENVHLPGGAFPSAHCAATTVMALFVRRWGKRAWFLFLPVAVLICASTVYGTFHYVTDAAAGILAGWAATVLARRLENLIGSPRLVVSATALEPDTAVIRDTQTGEIP